MTAFRRLVLLALASSLLASALPVGHAGEVTGGSVSNGPNVPFAGAMLAVTISTDTYFVSETGVLARWSGTGNPTLLGVTLPIGHDVAPTLAWDGFAAGQMLVVTTMDGVYVYEPDLNRTTYFRPRTAAGLTPSIEAGFAEKMPTGSTSAPIVGIFFLKEPFLHRYKLSRDPLTGVLSLDLLSANTCRVPDAWTGLEWGWFPENRFVDGSGRFFAMGQDREFGGDPTGIGSNRIWSCLPAADATLALAPTTMPFDPAWRFTAANDASHTWISCFDSTAIYRFRPSDALRAEVEYPFELMPETLPLSKLGCGGAMRSPFALFAGGCHTGCATGLKQSTTHLYRPPTDCQLYCGST